MIQAICNVYMSHRRLSSYWPKLWNVQLSQMTYSNTKKDLTQENLKSRQCCTIQSTEHTTRGCIVVRWKFLCDAKVVLMQHLKMLCNGQVLLTYQKNQRAFQHVQTQENIQCTSNLCFSLNCHCSHAVNSPVFSLILPSHLTLCKVPCMPRTR